MRVLETLADAKEMTRLSTRVRQAEAELAEKKGAKQKTATPAKSPKKVETKSAEKLGAKTAGKAKNSSPAKPTKKVVAKPAVAKPAAVQPSKVVEKKEAMRSAEVAPAAGTKSSSAKGTAATSAGPSMGSRNGPSIRPALMKLGFRADEHSAVLHAPRGFLVPGSKSSLDDGAHQRKYDFILVLLKMKIRSARLLSM